MPVDNYCVLYIPDTEKAVVRVIRILYSGRDIEAQLKKYTKMERKSFIKYVSKRSPHPLPGDMNSHFLPFFIPFTDKRRSSSIRHRYSRESICWACPATPKVFPSLAISSKSLAARSYSSSLNSI